MLQLTAPVPPSVSRTKRFGLAVAGAAVLSVGATIPARAQDWLILQGIVDGEFWASDSGSRMLTRNEGRPGVLGAGRLFAGIAPTRNIQLVGLGAVYGGSAYVGDETFDLEGVSLRVF